MFSLKPSVNDKEQNFLLGKPGEVFRYNTDFKYIKYGLSSSSVQPFFFLFCTTFILPYIIHAKFNKHANTWNAPI